jgi:hypothetical protein
MSSNQIARRVFGISKETLIALIVLPLSHVILLDLFPAAAKLINGLFVAGAQIAAQLVLFYSLQKNMLAVTGRGILASIRDGFTQPEPLTWKCKPASIEAGSHAILSLRVQGEGEDRLDNIEKEMKWEMHEIKQRQEQLEGVLSSLEEAIEETRSGAHHEGVQMRNRKRNQAIDSINREVLVMFFISYSSIASVLVSVFG